MSTYKHAPEENPETVEIRDAATVLVVRDAPELEVLMLQRGAKLAFGPRAWVFPGGRVDRHDADHGERVGKGLTDTEASRLLGVEGGGLAWWFAACRETLEEAGLLLGDTGTSDDTVNELRRVAEDEPSAFVAELERQGVELDLSTLHEVARFTTPVGPPRRFDTRFFLAPAPDRQDASHDDGEMVDMCWVKPVDAVGAWGTEEFPLMPVTLRMLSLLARFDTAAHALEVAGNRPEPVHVHIEDPDGAYKVLLPGEPGYEEAKVRIDHGWVRLWK